MVDDRRGTIVMGARTIGVLSDTHGLLREQVRSRLSGCCLIIHAGDVGSGSVLAALEEIAEVVAVRGNVDQGAWAQTLKEVEYVDVEGIRICVVHDRSRFVGGVAPAETDILIYGHSHKPSVEQIDGILYFNPGSVGPRRFGLPISMALLHVEQARVIPEIIELSG